jgi:S-formylglutathione hydrolase FrmB
VALLNLKLSNQNHLRTSTSVSAIVPETGGPFSVLYLLHGLSDDESVWLRRTSLERYAEKFNCLIVCPNGGRGFYTDSFVNPTQAYESFVIQDLIPFIDKTFKTNPRRRMIAGNSMGGYGAFKFSFKYPQLFFAAASLSGSFFSGGPRDLKHDPIFEKEYELIYGPRLRTCSERLFELASHAKGKIPPLYFECGKQEELIEVNRQFSKHLKKLKVKHIYKEFEGVHDWDYWDAGIVRVLAWFQKCLTGY